MATPYRQLQIRRGLKIDLPTGADGEPLFCEDTNELFIGTTSSGNLKPNQGYTPGTPSNWSGTPPSNFASALDRLAAAVRSLLGGPIP